MAICGHVAGDYRSDQIRKRWLRTYSGTCGGGNPWPREERTRRAAPGAASLDGSGVPSVGS